MLFGQPIQYIRYTLNSPHCDMEARSDSILFAPMHEPTYQRLKQHLKFVPLYLPQDAECVGDTNYPIAIFNKKGNPVVLDIEHIEEC